MRLGLALLLAPCLFAQPVRIQLTTGGHDHDVGFYAVFQGHDDWKVTVNPHPTAFGAGLLRNTDVLVLYDMTGVSDEKQRANLRAFVESGKGMVVLHHALLDNRDWSWWYQEVVGGLYGENATFRHDIWLEVTPLGDHPVLSGIGPFRIYDEGYKGFWMSDKVKPLLETTSEHSNRYIAWISPYPKSRVVYIMLGHGPEAHSAAVYRKLVRNAVQWAAGRD